MVRKRVLIVYGSGFGSTAEIAHAIAKELQELNITTQVLPVERARAPYVDEAVIIGAPIRYDRWLTEVRSYIRKYQNELSSTYVAYFYTCLALVKQPSSSFNSVQVYDQTLIKMNRNVEPIMVAGFPGTLQPKRMPWYYRYPLKLIAMGKGVEDGDYRNWDMIRRWSRQVSKVV
jgi:menaquinone-dependent protoporphyrinogen oxidase